jgi:hypothetical protein
MVDPQGHVRLLKIKGRPYMDGCRAGQMCRLLVGEPALCGVVLQHVIRAVLHLQLNERAVCRCYLCPMPSVLLAQRGLNLSMTSIDLRFEV